MFVHYWGLNLVSLTYEASVQPLNCTHSLLTFCFKSFIKHPGYPWTCAIAQAGLLLEIHSWQSWPLLLVSNWEWNVLFKNLSDPQALKFLCIFHLQVEKSHTILLELLCSLGVTTNGTGLLGHLPAIARQCAVAFPREVWRHTDNVKKGRDCTWRLVQSLWVLGGTVSSVMCFCVRMAKNKHCAEGIMFAKTTWRNSPRNRFSKLSGHHPDSAQATAASCCS